MKLSEEELLDFLRTDADVHRAAESTAANILLETKPPVCLMVTSSWPSEGKSSVLLHLGYHCANFGLRTTMIDGDLRRPTLTSVFGLENEPGAAEWIDGSAQVAPSKVARNLRFLPAGRSAGRVYQSLVVGATLPLLTQMKTDSDIILLDSTPLSVGTDAMMLARDSDGVIFVTSRRKFRGTPEGHFVEDLLEQGCKVLGVVVVGFRDASLDHEDGSRLHKLLQMAGLRR